MPVEYIGQKRKELLGWIKGTWLKSGPPVCFVHGFPGTGKSSIADVVAEESGLNYIRCDSNAPVGSVDDLLLEVQESSSEVGDHFLERALFQDGLDPSTAILRYLESPVLVVVHEGQRYLDPKTGEPWPTLFTALQRVARRVGVPGRLLILANQLVSATGKASEPFAIRRLEGLTLDEGLLVLNNLLTEFGREKEIPESQRRDIVKCLGCNPRALRTLVGCLESSSLLELIQTNPDAWVPSDHEVSPELVEKLEEGIIQNRFARVGTEVLRFVGRLSVHRQSVPVAALNDLAEGGDSAANRQELTNLLWLEHSVGKFQLHPLVREVALSKLKPSELQNAHSRAADYYLRPFIAREMVGGCELAGSFAEVRYHLMEAERGDELGDIAKRYTEYLKRVFKSVSPVPEDPRVLDDRIGVLSVLLAEPGAKGLEHYLARLLQARGKPEDFENAVVHAGRATGTGAPCDSWLLRLRLEFRVRGFEVAEKTFRKAIKKVPSEDKLFSLYQFGAEMLERAGKPKEALERLKEGIKQVRPEHNVSVLYQRAIEFSARLNVFAELEVLTTSGLAAIPIGEFKRHRIAEAALRELRVAKEIKRLRKLLAVKGKAAVEPPQQALGECLVAELEKQTADVLAIVKLHRKHFPNYHLLGVLEADAHITTEDIDGAVEALRGFQVVGQQMRDNPAIWFKSLVLWLGGRADEARQFLRHYAVKSYSTLSLDDFVEAWQRARDGTNRPYGDYFPKLATYIENHRAAKSVTPIEQKQIVLAVATEWASGNGGLSTFNRDLCRAFAKQGRKVYCFVANASPAEVAKAGAEDSVTVIVAPKEVGASVGERLRNRPQLPDGVVPGIILSHDRITGPAGASLIEHHFPDSKQVLFIHTSPSQIEWFKEQGDDSTATSTSETRRQVQLSLAKKADLVACVGPKLYLSAVDDLRALTPAKEPFEFLPGLDSSSRPATIPVANNCLILGRAEDDDLKGLDIAARAIAKLHEGTSQAISPKPNLIVRGAPVGTGDALRQKLIERTKIPPNHIQIREYSSDADVVTHDMLGSALVLMPSRTEGFGLAALEAIALGVPVLISEQSGLSDTIKRICPELAKQVVVPVTTDMETDAVPWERAIEFVLRDKATAFKCANELQKQLASEMSWEKSVKGMLEALEAVSKPKTA
jgi:glycosyltransferase involved in cell wall biosynthesis/tetratricopeptide (TPR) repeat protein